MEARLAWCEMRLRVCGLLVAGCLSVAFGVPGTAAGQVPAVTGSPAAAGLTQVEITSDPSGQPVTVDGRLLATPTPVTVDLYPGRYRLMVNAEGFQPLSHDLVVPAAGHLAARFVLLRTPPEPPTPDDLRLLAEMAGPEASSLGTSQDQARWAATTQANNACLECHPRIPKLQREGAHKAVACAECHAELKAHVREGQRYAAMPVADKGGIQMLCLACHEQGKKRRTSGSGKTIVFPEHLTRRKVAADNSCSQCHHVHAPMKWVYEARQMVGLPELMVTVPLLTEEAALRTQHKYAAMGESFLVFPLAPGVIGKAAFSDDSDFPSDALLISGAVLVVGSYVLSKVLYTRQLAAIHRENTKRKAANLRARTYNQLVEKAMAEYGEALFEWDAESEGRGRVTVRDLSANQ